MAETTGNDDLAAAVRDRGMEQLEGAKGQLAEGAERVAAAVDRTAERLEEDGDNAISGFGHSVASLMRQLAGGLRERDVEDFARELAALTRRNPGVFLAGSVALGFGIARFFKARTPQSSQMRGDEGWQSASGGTRDSTRFEREHDAEERLDLSANSTQRRDSSPDSASKSRSTKHRAKPQRASTPREQQQPSSAEPSATESTPTTATSDSNDSAFTGGTGGGTLPGGKS